MDSTDEDQLRRDRGIDPPEELKVMPEPPPSPTRPYTPEQLMPLLREAQVPPIEQYRVPSIGMEPPVSMPTWPPTEPEANIPNSNTWENQHVGPHGETRASCRRALLVQLDKLRADVAKAADRRKVDEKQAVELQLRIHREQAALLGLSTAHLTVPGF